MDIATPRRLSTGVLLSPLPVALYLILRPLVFSSSPFPALYTSLGFAIIAAVSVAWLIPLLGPAFVRVGLKGKDLLKNRDEVV
jgi:UDP-N-acetylglucosamine--dolichyl-phosphate N-acetylglucosaminephosphotransferase